LQTFLQINDVIDFRLNHNDLNQSPIGVGTGCYDDMALNVGGGLVLLNHDSSIGGGYGVVSGGDCLLTGGGVNAYRRESNAYKTTADLLQLCGTTTGCYMDHGGCTIPADIGGDASPHGGRYHSNSNVIYGTATYRYGRAGDVPAMGGPESDDTGFVSTCTCYDECRHGELGDSTSTTAVSSEADLLQQQQLQQQQQQTSSAENDVKTVHQVCFKNDELIGRKLLFGRGTSDAYCDDASPTNVHGNTVYDWVPAGSMCAHPAVSTGDLVADRTMRTHRGTHSTKMAISSGTANTLPRGRGPVCTVANGEYDISGNCRALGVATSHAGS